MMGKRFNKKGFTLVELLAVIVVLAILVLLAMPRVTSMMEKSRVNSFAVEANEILKVAQTAYNDRLLNGTDDATSANYVCYTVDQLIAYGYLDKDKGEIVGAIVLQLPTASATDQSVKTYMYLSKGDYYMKNVKTKAKNTNVEEADNLYSACTGSGTVTCTASGTNAATVKCGSTTISTLPAT